MTRYKASLLFVGVVVPLVFAKDNTESVQAVNKQQVCYFHYYVLLRCSSVVAASRFAFSKLTQGYFGARELSSKIQLIFDSLYTIPPSRGGFYLLYALQTKSYITYQRR